MIGTLKREAERDFDKFVKDYKRLEEEIKKLNEYRSIEIKTCNRYREKCDNLEEENRKLKLHIEAKDKAYTALLKDYEELKEDNKRLRAEIEEWLNAVRKSLEK